MDTCSIDVGLCLHTNNAVCEMFDNVYDVYFENMSFDTPFDCMRSVAVGCIV